MLTKNEFIEKVRSGIRILDGATGSNLMKAGMPMNCCAEEWILANPDVLVALQRQYAQAGSQLIYAPTFQAQPLGLARANLENHTETVNAHLVALSRSAAPNALIGGDISTLAAFLTTWDPDNYDDMVANYRRQIRGLIDGGADFLIAETLLYLQEAEAVMEAAEAENAGAVAFSFTMQSDGTLYSGMDAGVALKKLEKLGAAAVGFNCVAADDTTCGLVSKLKRSVTVPLICKPNAGIPVKQPDGSSAYSLEPDTFGAIMGDCYKNGADLLGGCCGTSPVYIQKLREAIS